MNYENYDPSFPDQPVVDRYLPLWANLPAFRSKPAFIWVEDGSPLNPTTLTYAQLNSSVHHIASQLLIPLQRRDTVLILCSPGLELAETIFGCQRAGLLSVPISPPNPSFTDQNFHHLIRALSQTKPKAAIAHSTYITNIHRYISSPSPNKTLVQMLQNLQWIAIDQIKTKETPKSQHSQYKGCKADDVYLVQYTSGATSIPKPVLVTAGSAAHNVRTARKAYDLHPNSVIVSWLPQYHDCGLMFLLLTIVSGATCVLTSPNSFINRPRLWLEMISEFNATCTPVPSFTLPLVVKRGGVDNGTRLIINLESMKNLIIINEPLYTDAVEQFVCVFRPFGLNACAISPSYGLAENCTFVSTAWRSSNAEIITNLPCHEKLLPSARLGQNDAELVDMDIVVVNEETHETVEDGVEGEIWVSSPSNASGYLSHPYLTHEVFYGRLKNKLTSRCFVRTGDRGVVKGDERYLFVTGRCVDVIKYGKGGGEVQEIHPHYVETAAYKSNPGVIRGGCVAAFEVLEEIVVVVEMQRSEMDVGVLMRVCEGVRKSVAEAEGVDVGVVVLVKGGSVPKTTSGKIQRWAAKDRFVGGEMKVLMEIKFGDFASSFATLEGRVDEGKRKGKRGQRGTTKVVGEETDEIVLSFSSSTTICPSLRSFL